MQLKLISPVWTAACLGNFLWEFWPLKDAGFACVCVQQLCRFFIALSTLFCSCRDIQSFSNVACSFHQVAMYSSFSVTLNKNTNIKTVERLITHRLCSVLPSTSLTCLVRPRLSLMSHPTTQRCFMLTNPDRFTICPATTCVFSAHTATLTFPAIIVSVAYKRHENSKWTITQHVFSQLK